MNRRNFPLVLSCRLTIAGFGLLFTGCEEELKPVPLRVVHVKGVVREGKRPMSIGWVEFFPVDGTVGNLRSAPLRTDGSFEADGVAVGANLIRLVNAPIESPDAAKLFGAYSSPIRRVIPDRAETPIEVNLVDELIRYQRTQGRPGRAESSGSGAPR